MKATFKKRNPEDPSLAWFERRIYLCLWFCPHPVYSISPCSGQPNGNALYSPDAYFCQRYSSWRPSHTRVSYGSFRDGCCGRCHFSGIKEKYIGIGQNHSSRFHYFWEWTHYFFSISCLLCIFVPIG